MASSKKNLNIKDGDPCKVVSGTHAGKTGTIRDIHESKSGNLTITVVQANGEHCKTLGRNVEVTKRPCAVVVSGAESEGNQAIAVGVGL